MSINLNETIQEIKDRADIVDVISSYIHLKKFGANSFKALCPFHNEKTPSFNVNPVKQMFYCFGCHKGGDVIKFVMDKEGVDFVNAIHILASKYNIIIPEKNTQRSSNSQSTYSGISKDRLFQIHEILTVFFETNLQNNTPKQVSDYLKQRALPEDIIKKFRIGAAPDSWTDSLHLLKSQGFTENEIVEAGVAIKKEENDRIYDRFRNRLLFPIWDEQNRVVAFSARSIEANPQGAKYINSPESMIFTKGKVLYALPLARNNIKASEHAILCEGQMDVIAMHRAGFTNAVAPQGTAFTDEQARLLKRYTEQVMLAFDSDQAGIKAIFRTIEVLLPIGFAIRVMVMPNGSDPDSIFKEQGYYGLRDIHAASLDFFDYLFNTNAGKIDKTSPQGQSKIVNNMLKIISIIPNSVLRASYTSRLAQYLSLPQNAVFQELNNLRKKDSYKKNYIQSSKNQNPINTQMAPPLSTEQKRLAKAEEALLEVILSDSSYARKLAKELPSEMISKTQIGQAINLIIAMTINDEWCDAENALLEQLRNSPNATITKIIASPYPQTEDKDKLKKHHSKTLNTCISTIKTHFYNRDIEMIKNKIRAETNEEVKDELYKECMKLITEMKNINTKHTN